MFNRMKLSFVAVAAFSLVTGVAGTASADPGKGLRWSDFAWGPSSRTQPTRTTPYYSAGNYRYSPNTMTLVPTPQGVATTPSTAATPTISILGSDGVVRVFPVTGGVVQQIPSQSTITVRDADGVTRTYPVVTGSSTGGSSVVVPTVEAPCHRR